MRLEILGKQRSIGMRHDIVSHKQPPSSPHATQIFSLTDFSNPPPECALGVKDNCMQSTGCVSRWPSVWKRTNWAFFLEILASKVPLGSIISILSYMLDLRAKSGILALRFCCL